MEVGSGRRSGELLPLTNQELPSGGSSIFSSEKSTKINIFVFN